MIQKLSDILVVSDMDGTLLSPDKTLHGANIETVRLFTALGGRFSVSTGRMPASIIHYPELAARLSPSIAGNGTIIYDFHNNIPLCNHTLPMPVAKRALREILAAFPALGAVVMGGDFRAYQAAPSSETQILFKEEDMSYLVRPAENLPASWIKIVFAASPDLLTEVEKFVLAQQYPGVYFLASSPVYFEMMPEGVSKGSALKELCGLLSCPLENTIAIGDYYNDIDLMKEAGHSVAMSTAPMEVRMLADEVTGSSEEGGVAQYLYKLIQQYGG